MSDDVTPSVILPLQERLNQLPKLSLSMDHLTFGASLNMLKHYVDHKGSFQNIATLMRGFEKIDPKLIIHHKELLLMTWKKLCTHVPYGLIEKCPEQAWFESSCLFLLTSLGAEEKQPHRAFDDGPYLTSDTWSMLDWMWKDKRGWHIWSPEFLNHLRQAYPDSVTSHKVSEIIHFWVRNRKLDQLWTLEQYGFDITEHLPDGSTYLKSAQHPDTVDVLLDLGVDPWKQDDQGMLAFAFWPNNKDLLAKSEELQKSLEDKSGPIGHIQKAHEFSVLASQIKNLHARSTVVEWEKVFNKNKIGPQLAMNSDPQAMTVLQVVVEKVKDQSYNLSWLRKWIERHQKALTDLMSRELDGLPLPILLISHLYQQGSYFTYTQQQNRQTIVESVQNHTWSPKNQKDHEALTTLWDKQLGQFNPYECTSDDLEAKGLIGYIKWLSDEPLLDQLCRRFNLDARTADGWWLWKNLRFNSDLDIWEQWKTWPVPDPSFAQEATVAFIKQAQKAYSYDFLAEWLDYVKDHELSVTADVFHPLHDFLQRENTSYHREHIEKLRMLVDYFTLQSAKHMQEEHSDYATSKAPRRRL